jgi:hypothetical protein
MGRGCMGGRRMGEEEGMRRMVEKGSKGDQHWGQQELGGGEKMRP